MASNMKTMAEMRAEEDAKKKGSGKKGTEAYSGGEKSGMAVYRPHEEGDGVGQEGQASGSSSSSSSGTGSGSGSQGQRGEGPPPEGAVRITVYSDGFTVNGGELRKLADPANKKFMDDINEGFVPEELRAGMSGDKPLPIAMEDKKDVSYADAKAQSAVGTGTHARKPGTFAALSEGVTAG